MKKETKANMWVLFFYTLFIFSTGLLIGYLLGK